MPETVRAASGGRQAHPRRSGFLACCVAAAWGAACDPTHALPTDGLGLGGPQSGSLKAYIRRVRTLDRHDIAATALTLGVLFFAVTTAILLVRTRTRAAAAEATLCDQVGALRADSDRLNALLRSEPQIVVSWAAADNEPHIVGDTSLVTPAQAPQRVLAFGSWLEPNMAQAMEHAVDALRANGESFTMQLMTLAGHAIEADGRVIGGRAVLRLRDVSGIKRDLAELNARHEKIVGEMESLRTLIDALPSPVWARDLAGALVYVNPAFVRAVEAKDPADAIARGVELLNRTVRDDASRSRSAGEPYAGRVPAIAAGNRRTFDVLDVPTRKGSAGHRHRCDRGRGPAR